MGHANPPHRVGSSCCVKSERVCRFLGRGSFGQTTRRNPVRSVWPSSRGRLKNLSTNETKQQPPFSRRGAPAGGIAPYSGDRQSMIEPTSLRTGRCKDRSSATQTVRLSRSFFAYK